MVTKLLIVWFLAVVAFFALWALLASVIKRFSERKPSADNTETESGKEDADSHPQLPE